MSDGVGIKVVRGTRVALVDLPGALDALQPRGWVRSEVQGEKGLAVGEVVVEGGGDA